MKIMNRVNMKIMKTVRHVFKSLAAIAFAACVTVSCEQPLEPSGRTPQAASSGTGLVVVTAFAGNPVSADSAVARTVLPVAPVFSRYKLVLSRADDSVPPITIDDAGDLAGSGASQELAAGKWTAEVTAYQTFTVTGGTAAKYPAAKGSAPLTVVAGQTTPVKVNIEPIPIEDAEAPVKYGIFTYTVSFPDDATGTLTFGNDAPVPLESGAKVSVEKPAGYYDVAVSITKGTLSAGVREKAHIYAGFESEATFEFKDEDFTQAVYLAGTLTLPVTVSDVTISGVTVTAYSDEARTSLIGGQAAVSNASANWTISVPSSNIGSTVYLAATGTGSDGNTYTGTGDSGVVTEAGKRDIVLSDTTPPADITGLTAALDTGDGNKVTLKWTDPPDADLDHIEITVSEITVNPDETGSSQTITVARETQTYLFPGLTGDAYTFTVRTVDTAGNKSGGKAVPLAANFTTVSAVQTFLNSVPDGATATISVAFNLANSTNGWTALLNAIKAANENATKYVALDLSACTPSNVVFDPGTGTNGVGKIVSLVLPSVATSIKAGNYSSSTFGNFTALTSVSGSGITSIGDYAFRSCAALTTADFPELTSIGEGAFSGCTGLATITVAAENTNYTSQGSMLLNKAGDTLVAYPSASGTVRLDEAITTIGGSAFWGCAGLTSVSAPGATTIGDFAFYGCAALATVNAPGATTIGNSVFSECASLATADFPEAKTIGNYAFSECALATADFPEAKTIGKDAFSGYAALTTVNAPAVTSIGNYAFRSCAALTTVNAPAVTSIGERAFAYTGTTALTVTLGSTAPTLGYQMFYNVSSAKIVTVRVPSAATGYGTSPSNTSAVCWGNGFRGAGWEITNGKGAFSTGSYGGKSNINSNITLTIQVIAIEE